MRRVGVVLWLLLLARGATAEEPTSLYREQAQVLRAAGDRLYRARDYREALDRYRRAHALFPSPMLLVSSAAAHERLGQPVEALQALIAFFADPGDSVPLVRETARQTFMRLFPVLSDGEQATILEEVRQRVPAALRTDLPEDIQDRLKPAELPVRALAPAPAPPPVLVTARAPAPRSRRRPGLTAAKWALTGLSLVLAGGGAGLLAVEGRCVRPFSAEGMELCKEVLATQDAGAALTAGAGALLGTAVILFALDR
jgi:tetratricopeptide (TPR) repeat protein